MDVSQITQQHWFFIPAVFFVGLIVGYTLGARAVRAEIKRQRKRLRD